jgi:hypothetical protein
MVISRCLPFCEDAPGEVLQRSFAAACRHISGGAIHTYLIIDRSGSMASRSISPDTEEIRSHRNFCQLNNVLGVVHEASMKYIRERSSRAPSDLLTYIPFNHNAVIHVQEQSMQDAPRILNSLMAITPVGGTRFSSALQTAHSHLKQVCFPGVRDCVPCLHMTNLLEMRFTRELHSQPYTAHPVVSFKLRHQHEKLWT